MLKIFDKTGLPTVELLFKGTITGQGALTWKNYPKPGLRFDEKSQCLEYVGKRFITKSNIRVLYNEIILKSFFFLPE